MKKKILFTIGMFMFILNAYPQSTGQIISGRIIAEKAQESSIHILVRAAKSKRAVTTETDGTFHILIVNIPDTLIISHIGYETKRIPITDTTRTLNLFLKLKVEQLEEVFINTGYQTAKPNEINGSVVSISNKVLNEQAGTNILQRLNGVTSGLAFSTGKSNGNPQNTSNITIRGLSTINGPLDPLIVLDNFIYEGDIKNINPNDVENITVLKDAAAASIWGARAGNGVIVITTKKGKFNQPLQIGFNANVIIAAKPDLYALSKMSSADYIDAEQLLFNKGYFDTQISSTPYAALTPAVDLFLKRRQGLISKADSASQINAFKATDSRDEYSKYFYKQAVTQQYALNLRGGGTNNNYNFSAAYDHNSDELYNKYQKINLRADNTFRPIEKLTLNVGLYFTSSEAESGRPAYNTIQVNGRQPNYLKFADANGNPLSIATAYREAYTDTAGNGKLLNWKYYPLDDYKHNTSTVKQQEIFANAGLNYKLTSYLNGDFKYQYQKQTSNAENLSDLDSYNARNIINSFSQLNRTTGIVKYIVPLGGIRTLNNSNVESQTARGQLNFNKSWNEQDVSIIAGAETRQVKNYSNGNTLYGYYADPLTSATVDMFNIYPNFITGNSATISNNASLSNIVDRFVSTYANGSFMFKKRYIFSASARQDGSNIFGANTNDKWKPLWSAGIGWDISKESFYKINWMPFFKLTATYGYSGNVDLSRSALPVAVYGTNASTNFKIARISTINNPELRWEQSGQLNLRAEFALSNQVITGSIDYYRKKGTDLYGDTPYDYTTWGRSATITKNVASMIGDGVDVILQSKNINRVFKWNTNLLFNYNTSKTTAYYSTGANNVFSLLGGGSSINPVVGKPLYAVVAYKWGGLSNTGNPQGYVNGVLSTDYTAINKEASTKGIDGNIVYKGAASPTYFGSLINSFTWKQFSATVNVGYKFGYYLFKPTISYQALIENGIGHGDYEKRWQKPGDENTTNIPSFVYPNISGRDAFFASSEANVIKGDHIRLNYVNVSYDIYNKQGQTKMPFGHIQLYVNAANLGILWRANKDHIDPDNVATIPIPKMIAIGLRSNF
jgi:TonB-linked SusC/RagA family outer membrane protein